MATNPNQRVVKIGPKEPCDKNHIYVAINKKVLFDAMRDLRENCKSKGAFDLWLYFASNQSGFETATGPACDCCLQTGLKKAGYESAFKDLVDRGYLVGEKNHYVFYEKPQKQEEKEVEDNMRPQLSENTTKEKKIPQLSENTAKSFLRIPRQLSENTAGGFLRNTEILQDNTYNTVDNTPQRPVEDSKQEQEEVVGEISESMLSSIPEEKIKWRREDKVCIVDIPNAGVYRICGK